VGYGVESSGFHIWISRDWIRVFSGCTAGNNGHVGITTFYCPATVPNVAFELLKMLTSEEEMAVIKKAMGFEEEC
jgi:hypothetical protein